MALSHSPSIVMNGLVLYLDAGNTKSYNAGISTTAWNDLSGSGNNGTLTNGHTYNSGNSGSIVFDGINDYAPTGTTGFPFGASAGTLSAWVKATSADPSNGNWIFSYGTAADAQSRFIGLYRQAYYFGGYGLSNDLSYGTVQTGIWFNIVGVYNGTQASLYLNGNLVVGPLARSWNTVANNSQIGRQTNGAEYWDGNIAQVSIYNRALSASEVSQNFNALRGRYGI